MKVTLKNIKKVYDKNGIEVVKNFNLEIMNGEFLVLVGPSGCGKSTLLRMIAGLETITNGELYFDNQLMNEVLPGKRNIGMVFQNYALYPHLSVFQNMEYPLKIKKIKHQDRKKKIAEVAKMLGLEDYLARKPKQLSGGQRQRVAVGREIVRDVSLFLMDEPLSNLDAKLRVQMRGEITKLHQDIKKTFIYVTHDQVEAMTMASRIVIMKDGEIMQVGSPKDVYDFPQNTFVAQFIGTPAMNLLKGVVKKTGEFIIGGESILLTDEKLRIIEKNKMFDQEVILGIRPEDIFIDSPVNSKGWQVKIDLAELLGSEYNLLFHLNDTQVTARIKVDELLKNGQQINISFDFAKIHFFDGKSGKVIS